MIGRNYVQGKTREEVIGKIGFSHFVVVDKNVAKKILVTGAGSYIGESFRKYANDYYPNLTIVTLDLLNQDWRLTSFSDYDIVYHVAGIAHADVGEVSDDTKERYYKVNTDLAIEICEKAKHDGVKMFVFMSSMIVYGDSTPLGVEKVINRETIPVPSNFYGDSKLQADVGVRSLASDDFKVIVLRPPMIYGKGSKGNYPRLAKLAIKLPVFPVVDNQRSMLYIGNLCEFLCQLMSITTFQDNAVVLIPQNSEWVKTSEMVREIANIHNKKQYNLGGPLKVLVLLGSKVPGKIGKLVNKAFGNSCYSHELSNYDGMEYQLYSLIESLQETEK